MGSSQDQSGTRGGFSRLSLRCCWPQKFTKRRQFNRQAENQPFIEYLLTQTFDGEEDDDDVSSKLEDELDGHRKKLENKDEHWINDKGAESCNECSNVRLFMTGMTGDEGGPKYRDQVDQVVSFCERASSTKSETERGEDRKCLLLLDDRNIGDNTREKKDRGRLYHGAMTPQELLVELSKQVLPNFTLELSSRETNTVHSVIMSTRSKISLEKHLKISKMI